MNRICGWKRGVATGVEIFANDSGVLNMPKSHWMSMLFVLLLKV